MFSLYSSFLFDFMAGCVDEDGCIAMMGMD